MLKFIGASVITLAATVSGCATVQPVSSGPVQATSSHRFEKSYTVGQEEVAYVGQPIAKVKDYWETTSQADALAADRAGSMRLPPFIRLDIPEGAPARLIGTTSRDGATYRVITIANPVAAALRFLLNDDGTFQGSAINFMGERMGFSYKPEPSDLRFVGKTFTQLDSSRGFTNFELVYSGATKESLNLLYREYTPDNLARPAFTQNLTYDRNSSTVRFREILIRVLGADNEGLRYVVEADGMTSK